MTDRRQKIRAGARKFSRALLELAYPSGIYCICCGRPIPDSQPYALCGDCMMSIRWANGRTCEKCGKILQDWYAPDLCLDCRLADRRFERGFSCVLYAEREKMLVHQLKYGKKGYLARKMADIMADRLAIEEFSPELIVPVPMHRRKERQRGYSQTALMAAALSERTMIPWKRNVLIRIRDTDPMSGLSRKARIANMQDAFAVPCGAEAFIRGRELLLVDDVFTTGSTADACAAALTDKGGKCVYLMAFAAGANEKPD